MSKWLPRTILTAIMIMLTLAFIIAYRILLNSPDRSSRLPPYQSVAIIGNSKLLVPLDDHGTFIGLFWPFTGKYQNIHNPHHWMCNGENTPRHTGAFLGVHVKDQPLIWLRDSKVVSQTYAGDTNILLTEYSLQDGRKITVKDWVLPDEDIIIQKIEIKPKCPQGSELIVYQNMDLGEQTGKDSAEIIEGLLVQWRHLPSIAVAVGSSTPLTSWHIGDPKSFQSVDEGSLNSSTSGSGNVISALCCEVSDETVVVYSLAKTQGEARAHAWKALRSSSDALEKQTGDFWRDWLSSGKAMDIPDPDLERLYKRSLMVLKLLQDNETGAVAGGARSFWSYCWPRDGVFTAAAFDLAGYYPEAEALYHLLARIQRPDGLWEARYNTDGTPVTDGRATQIDTAGYFPWGVWLHVTVSGDHDFASRMYPTVRRAADHVLATLDPQTGLPGPSSDYWESSKHLKFYMSNSIVCWAGLISSANLADTLGRKKDVRRYRAGAERIEHGVLKHLWSEQKKSYIRATEEFVGVDSAACWAVSPFGMFEPDDPRLVSTVKRMEFLLTTGQGGITPGEDWIRHDPWVHETLFLLLYHCATKNTAESNMYFNWVKKVATNADTLPETISLQNGMPNSTTPLAWAHAYFIFSAVERWGQGVPKPRQTRPSPP